MTEKLRRCKVKSFINGPQEREGWFHGFFQHTSGDHGEDACPVALVEYDDGRIEEEPASRLTMLEPHSEAKAIAAPTHWRDLVDSDVIAATDEVQAHDSARWSEVPGEWVGIYKIDFPSNRIRRWCQ